MTQRATTITIGSGASPGDGSDPEVRVDHCSHIHHKAVRHASVSDGHLKKQLNFRKKYFELGST